MINPMVIIQFIHPHGDSVNCLLLNTQGQTERIINTIKLKDVLELTHDRTIIALLPSQVILLTQIRLPVMNSSRLAQAIPFAIEEQLNEDLAELHISYGKQHADGSINIAVINKTLLQNYLDQFNALRLNVTTMLPDVLALPDAASTWTVAFTVHTTLIKTTSYQGFACDQQNFVALLELALTQTNTKPTRLVLLNATPQIMQALAHLTIELVNEPNTTLLQKIDAQAIRTTDLNLLQGDFRPSYSLKNLHKRWHKSLKLLFIACGIFLMSNLLQLLYLSYKNNQQQQQLTTLIPSTPSNTIDTSFNNAMQSLAKINQGGHFFNTLRIVGPALKNAIPQIQLESINFNSKELLLKVRYQDEAAVKKLTKELNKELTATIMNTDKGLAELKITLNM